MSGPPYVFLVPGFLGFVDLGRFEYFRGVGERLRGLGGAEGAATVVRVEIHPTASLRERATQLASVIHAHAGGDERPIHLVAHSTGGLDARLLLTPGATLPVAIDLEALARRVRSLVSVASPHHGTPLASFFDGLAAQTLLRLGSQGAATALSAGRIPLELLQRVAGLLGRLSRSRSDELALPPAAGELLDALPEDERGPLQRMVERIGEDQALVPQLAPEGIELFNASTNDRPGVRYGCVVARSPRPGLSRVIQAGAHPGSQTSSALYSALHRIAARTPATRSRALDPARCHEVASALGGAVDWADSDGVVPTLSQVWGELVHAASADHLDVVGHFGDDVRPVEHRDVLVSGSGFGRMHFDAVWRDVAAFIRGAQVRALPESVAIRASSAAEPMPGTEVAVPEAGPVARPRPMARATVAAARGLTVLAAFLVYEAWCWVLGDGLLVRGLGFVACVLASWRVASQIGAEVPADSPALPGR